MKNHKPTRTPIQVILVAYSRLNGKEKSIILSTVKKNYKSVDPTSVKYYCYTSNGHNSCRTFRIDLKLSVSCWVCRFVAVKDVPHRGTIAVALSCCHTDTKALEIAA